MNQNYYVLGAILGPFMMGLGTFLTARATRSSGLANAKVQEDTGLRGDVKRLKDDVDAMNARLRIIRDKLVLMVDVVSATGTEDGSRAVLLKLIREGLEQA